MAKNSKFYAIVLLLLLVVLAAGAAGWFFLKEYNQSVSIVEPTKKVVKAPPKDLSLLLERMSAPLSRTPEQIKEEARIDDKQVERAREWLESADPRQRMMGAEQLSAYPTAQAEKLLVDTLANDLDMEVRSVAARSLGFFEQPKAKTLGILLRVLEYDNEAVCLDVLNTLQAYVGREPYGSKRTRQIIKKLKKIAKSGGLEGGARTVLQNFLADQASGG